MSTKRSAAEQEAAGKGSAAKKAKADAEAADAAAAEEEELDEEDLGEEGEEDYGKKDLLSIKNLPKLAVLELFNIVSLRKCLTNQGKRRVNNNCGIFWQLWLLDIIYLYN